MGGRGAAWGGGADEGAEGPGDLHKGVGRVRLLLLLGLLLGLLATQFWSSG